MSRSKLTKKKIQWKRNPRERERVQNKIYSLSWTHHLRSLSCRIPMLCTNFSNVALGNDFVNKSVKLSFGQICCTLLSLFSSRS